MASPGVLLPRNFHCLTCVEKAHLRRAVSSITTDSRTKLGTRPPPHPHIFALPHTLLDHCRNWRLLAGCGQPAGGTCAARRHGTHCTPIGHHHACEHKAVTRNGSDTYIVKRSELGVISHFRTLTGIHPPLSVPFRQKHPLMIQFLLSAVSNVGRYRLACPTRKGGGGRFSDTGGGERSAGRAGMVHEPLVCKYDIHLARKARARSRKITEFNSITNFGLSFSGNL